MRFESIGMRKFPAACGAGLAALFCLSAATAVQAAPASRTADRVFHTAWRAAISKSVLPGEGCFAAEYPGMDWKRVTCGNAPARPLLPASGPHSFVVGNGNDHAAETATPISTATGSFPSIKGLKNETDD